MQQDMNSAIPKRARDPICEVCGHCHVQGVKCQICGHVGKYIVPGGPNRPNPGFKPPVPPGSLEHPNTTSPWIEGITVAQFQKALQDFFHMLPQMQAQQLPLPHTLSNFDQLKIILETLPDYPLNDTQPSYVMGLPCRPILADLQLLLSGTISHALDSMQDPHPYDLLALNKVDLLPPLPVPGAVVTPPANMVASGLLPGCSGTPVAVPAVPMGMGGASQSSADFGLTNGTPAGGNPC